MVETEFMNHPSTFHGTRAVLGSIFEPGVPTTQGVQHSGKELCPSLRSPKSVSPKCNKDAWFYSLLWSLSLTSLGLSRRCGLSRHVFTRPFMCICIKRKIRLKSLFSSNRRNHLVKWEVLTCESRITSFCDRHSFATAWAMNSFCI